ncbi:cysteine-rich protein 1-like [Paramacrobiotus metropolitanus]|uniref:cysteine-rich protein 1-like n=1 Tax=Paramacrobiotus metropolitanus TaxID=2943436 RepID=UPI0024462B6D|nr:cysteine-rich protein 1-like [Paramacrobiotus metropolitanus]
MPKCPRCSKEVYFAERRTSMGKDWHRECLRCERCSKTLSPGQHSEHEGRPYCNVPCYQALFGPQGCGMARGTVGSFVYDNANPSDKSTSDH